MVYLSHKSLQYSRVSNYAYKFTGVPSNKTVSIDFYAANTAFFYSEYKYLDKTVKYSNSYFDKRVPGTPVSTVAFLPRSSISLNVIIVDFTVQSTSGTSFVPNILQ